MIDHSQAQLAMSVPQENGSGQQGEWKSYKEIGVWFLAILLIVTASGCNSGYKGTEVDGEAPDFKLTDQIGSLIHLSDFRGKVVVLTFMDSECKDTCPLTAAQLRQAYQQLDQGESSQTAFIGVNVNVEANKVADVSEITRTWNLEEIPSWHFLTGSREDLEVVWKDYGVAVAPSINANDIMHTPGVFLIDPSGQMRWYISTPFSEEKNTDMTLPLSELLVTHIRELLGENSS